MDDSEYDRAATVACNGVGLIGETITVKWIKGTTIVDSATEEVGQGEMWSHDFEPSPLWALGTDYKVEIWHGGQLKASATGISVTNVE